MRSFATVIIVSAAIAAPTFARESTGYQSIAAGDLSRAEAMLNAERRIFPQKPELMLNLAAVYSRTGRADAARALYGQVLDRPSVAMLMPSGGSESSHDVAQRGLSKLTSAVLATR